MCITVRRHGMGSGMVGHVQQSVRKMAKHTLKELKELNKVSTTSLNARIWSFLLTGHSCFASHCYLVYTHRSHCGLQEVVAAFWVPVFTSVFVSVS